MVKLCVAAAAVAMLGMATASVFAEEVNLSEHDRMELRQRADSLRDSNMLGRDHAMQETRMNEHGKMRHTSKKHHGRKHTRHPT